MANSRFEVIKRAASCVVRALFVDYFYLTLVAIGLLLMLGPLIIFPDKENTSWVRATGHIGEAILTAGAVTTFMRFFASLDIVGERIERWLSNDAYLKALCVRLTEAVYEPERLQDLGALNTVWRNISLAITRHAFPQIAGTVYDKTLNQILKACADYYFVSYRRVTNIAPTKDVADFVEIEHELHLTVIANQNNASTKFQTKLLLDEFTDGAPVVQFFQVDGTPREVKAKDAGVATRSGVTQYELETELVIGRPVKLSYRYRFRQSITNDPFLLWTTTRYVCDARCEVNYPPDLIECGYQDTAFEPLLQQDGASRPGRLVYNSSNSGLIFPGSAFILILRRRSKTHDSQYRKDLEVSG
jgi:hypothetical protein